MLSDTDSGTIVVLKYYLYRAVGGPGFIAPIYVLYLLSNGLSYAEIGAIGSIQGIIVLAGEIPTGYVGDRIGRRNSLLVAQVLLTGSAVGMILASGFLAFTVSFGLLSFAMTFVSGSDDAWLYDILREYLDEDRYTHVRGRGGAVGQWVTAATMIAGSLLYVVEPVYPFVAVLVMRVSTFFVVLTLPKTARFADDRRADSQADAENDRLTIVDALPIIRRKLTEPPLRSFVAYVALFVGLTMPANAYVQPIAVDALESSVGAALAGAGIPEAASLGVLYASFTAVSAIASDRASDLEAAFGVRKALLVVPVVTGAMMVLPALLSVLAFPMFFVLRGSRSVLRPITGQYVNDHVESVGRATVLSAVSMVHSLARIPTTFASGVVADWFSPLLSVAVLGGAFLVAGLALFAWRPPVEGDDEVGAPEGTVAE
jgi:MFS family permease